MDETYCSKDAMSYFGWKNATVKLGETVFCDPSCRAAKLN